ncbi:MAG: phosphosulfolactate synthase [Chloroflexota bacterium]|nr:phosphosulfolactate synthase [Chloroflexota bacterium]
MEQFLTLPERTEKPRQNGLTHVLDKGLGPNAVQDLLNTSADYIDVVKLGWGTSYVTANLPEKIRIYHIHGTLVCLGGTLVEIAIAQGQFDALRKWLADLRLRYVEISNGVTDLTQAEKGHYIRELSKDFTVLSEVGKKDPSVELSPRQWIDMIEQDLEAGAWKVITEARESGTIGIYKPDRSVRKDLVTEITARIPPDRLLFEAPHKSQQVWLIQRFGPNANLGNIPANEVVALETLRLGLRGDTAELSLTK